MNEQKHTPGPWVHHPEDNIICTHGGRGLLEWQARSVHVSTAERDANARLIAAAPELLAALMVALDTTYSDKLAAEWEQIIAKATGSKP